MRASSKRKRLYFFLIMLIVAIVATVAGTFVPVDSQTAQQELNQLNQTVTQSQASGTLPEYIFVNNYSITLAMFLPIVGAIFGFYVLFSTGVVLGIELRGQDYSGASVAASSINPVTALLALAGIAAVFALEYVSYTVGIGESIWLFRRIMQRRWFEVKNTALLIAICAALLAVGAVVETLIINAGF